MSERSLPFVRAPEASPRSAAPRRRVVRLATVALYTLVFFAALPWALWQLGARFDGWFSLAAPPFAVRFGLGAPLTLLGSALMGRAMRVLWALGRGLPISHLPPERLVERDVFARFRHPIYLGYSLTFAGLGLASGSLGRGGGSVALLTLAWLAYAVGLEEPTLRRRFGSSYERYAEVTTRLLPRSERTAGAALRLWRWVRPALERLASWAVLFRFRSSIWVSFGLFVGLGVAAASSLGSVLFASGLPQARVDEYLFVLVAGLALGGRLAWLAYNGRRLLREPWVTLRSVGFVSFGSYLALFLIIALWPRLRAQSVDPFWLFDRTLVACFLASAIGRIGCHTYGCCYGRPVAHGLCVREPLSKVVRERGAAGHEPRFPLQLVSAAWALLVSGLGLGLLAASGPSGVSACVSILVYALGRFGLESFRDEPRFWRERFTRGQLLCMALASGALGLLLFEPFPRVSGFESRLALAAPLAHSPVILLLAGLSFVISGYQRHEVGRW